MDNSTVQEIMNQVEQVEARRRQLDARLRRRIRYLIGASGLTQADLARITGLSEKTVSMSLNPKHALNSLILGWAANHDALRSPRGKDDDEA